MGTKKNQDVTILLEKSLSNNALMTIIDESRKIAADRWFVKVRCVVTIPWEEWMDQEITGESTSPEDVRASLEPLTFEMVKERNFIDQKDKDGIVEGIQAMICDTIIHYMERAQFIQKIFHKKLLEWRERQALIAAFPAMEELNEDDEPDDFSACFR